MQRITLTAITIVIFGFPGNRSFQIINETG